MYLVFIRFYQQLTCLVTYFKSFMTQLIYNKRKKFSLPSAKLMKNG